MSLQCVCVCVAIRECAVCACVYVFFIEFHILVILLHFLQIHFISFFVILSFYCVLSYSLLSYFYFILFYSIFIFLGKKEDLIVRLEEYENSNAQYEDEKTRYLAEFSIINSNRKKIRGIKSLFSDSDFTEEEERDKENLENIANCSFEASNEDDSVCSLENGGKKRKFVGIGKNTFGLSLALQ